MWTDEELMLILFFIIIIEADCSDVYYMSRGCGWLIGTHLL